MLFVDGRRVDGEVRAGDGGEGRREAVHVIEQVECVRDADEPDESDDDGNDVVREQLHVEPGGDHDPCRAELRDQLQERLQADDIVDQPGKEDEGAPADDPEQLFRRLEHVEEERDADPGEEAAVDPDASEGRRRLAGPALARRNRDEPSAERGTEERADDEIRRRQCGDGHGRAHAA